MLNFKTFYSYSNKDFMMLIEGYTCRPMEHKREPRKCVQLILYFFAKVQKQLTGAKIAVSTNCAGPNLPSVTHYSHSPKKDLFLSFTSYTKLTKINHELRHKM